MLKNESRLTTLKSANLYEWDKNIFSSEKYQERNFNVEKHLFLLSVIEWPYKKYMHRHFFFFNFNCF